MLKILLALSATFMTIGCGKTQVAINSAAAGSSPALATNMTIDKITKTDAEWQKLLTPEQYRVARKTIIRDLQDLIRRRQLDPAIYPEWNAPD